MVKDVVCGMYVAPPEAAAQAEYEGDTYYFCSEKCRSMFAADPARYIGQPPQTARAS
jgi:P-type Cu+ transporter